ncbi:MAG TPA: serine hydrolase domain-containing protein [Actinomycetota bacterium]|nr:serine hydrolase domain-containing protein [Actinomycetota bacterium]
MPAIDLDGARRALDVLLERIPHEHDGAQLYVSLGGDVVLDEAVGEASPGVPMTPDHITLWFSSGKPLTAVAVARLWEAGLLSLDDRVARFIPEFAAAGKDAVTIRHVLTHTGGFRKIPARMRFWDWDEQVRAVCETPAEWPAGKFAGYHPASGWVVLAEIVRRVDGRRIDEYLAQDVLGPLGMTSTRLGIPPDEQSRLGPLIAHAHPKNPAPQYAVASWNEPQGLSAVHPGGGMRGPARELGLFYECLLCGGEPLLRPQTVEALVATHRVNRMDHTFGVAVPWGLGFVRYGIRPVAPIGGPRSFGHGGHSSSIGYADPEAGLVVALVTNGLPGAVEHDRRVRAVIKTIYGAIDGLPDYDGGNGPGPVSLGRDS